MRKNKLILLGLKSVNCFLWLLDSESAEACKTTGCVLVVVVVVEWGNGVVRLLLLLLNKERGEERAGVVVVQA